MNNQDKLCQSCGMPMDKDPQGGGSNANKSKNNEYCSFCFQNGKFYDEGISLQDKIEKNIQIATTKFGIAEETARKQAESLLPSLKRWKAK